MFHYVQCTSEIGEQFRYDCVPQVHELFMQIGHHSSHAEQQVLATLLPVVGVASQHLQGGIEVHVYCVLPCTFQKSALFLILL